MAKILVIDDDKMMCNALEKIITRMGHECAYSYTIKDGREILKKDSFDIVLLDVQLPDGNGLDLLPELRKSSLFPEIIIITSAGNSDGAELAIKNGAWNYLEKPFSNKDINREINHVVSYRETKQMVDNPVVFNRSEIVGNSYQLNQCTELLAKASSNNASVLITGDTGTGKELAAKAIHANSQRCDKNFIVVDCASIPGTLIESLLFGCKKGAFTGADQDRDGLIKQADGGTLFLDEVGELPLEFQKTFLRVLQEHSFRPLGAKREEESHFRVVSATNRDLSLMVGRKEFRNDLLFRLQSITIRIPQLRERVSDINDLTKHYVAKFCKLNNLGIKEISKEFLDSMSAYSWPGNVRELVNAIEWTIIAAKDNKEIIPRHLPENIRIQIARSSIHSDNLQEEETKNTSHLSKKLPVLQEARKTAIIEFEKKYLNNLISIVNGNSKKACEMSGLARSQLYNLLCKHKLSLRKK